MNNICEVIRTISEDFSEIKVYPSFNDDLDGSGWCTECQVGNNGTPQRHTCEEYQDIINELEDVENAIICIVENRLLANEPVEFKKIILLDEEIIRRDKLISDKSLAITELDKAISSKENELKRLENVMSNSNEVIESTKKDIETYSKKISELKNQYTITSPLNIDITKNMYEKLIKRDYILTCLENGGVDNWEWYGESYPREEDLKELENETNR